MAKDDNRRPADPPVEADDDGLDAQRHYLLELAAWTMPYGRYRGMRLVDLPEPYVVWLARKGFPESRLGEMLETVYVIKANGLEYLFARGK